MIYLCATSGFIWLILLCLPFRPWSTRESFSPDSQTLGNLGEITALIPARNEENHIQDTLLSLENQGTLAKIIVVNDQSLDRTEKRITSLRLKNLDLINGTSPPEGWTGKVWALNQGLQNIKTPYVLLIDADITLAPNIVYSLVQKIKNENLDLVSLMAVLRTGTLWEKLLIPSFIYFFKLLYPFALSNHRKSKIAAAAGGLILIKTDRLLKIGGFAALRDAIIDDCALARLVKTSGGRTWIGLSHSVTTTRPYDSLRNIWNMVARTAFTQLHYSTSLLAASTFLLVLAFIVPMVGLVSGEPIISTTSFGAIIVMFLTYYPIIKFYGLKTFWAVTLPFSALLFLLMTWTSAVRFWKGERSHWKNRTYSK